MDIPEAFSESMRKARGNMSSIEYGPGDEKNAKELSDLVSRYPELTVRLKYKRKVIQERECDALYWPVEEEVSLHRMAAQCFMELFKMADAKMALCSSKMSLRAIHVVAIALRGLLRRAVGLEISAAEKCALGTVTHAEARQEDEISIMMEKKRDGARKRSK